MEGGGGGREKGGEEGNRGEKSGTIVGEKYACWAGEHTGKGEGSIP